MADWTAAAAKRPLSSQKREYIRGGWGARSAPYITATISQAAAAALFKSMLLSSWRGRGEGEMVWRKREGRRTNGRADVM